MRRLSQVIEDLVSDIDALSGKCFTKHDDADFGDRVDEFGLGYMVADVALVNADAFLTGVAQALEYCVGKPLYHAENLILGRSENRPCFIYSK